ncbi:MAG TPA: endolytic transglycosylase MltG [Candidatus Eisenbacteria bacterium]|nr:endolytic transglycosylase MltG [Candidatus Eisenbacteria bacterium]
MKKKQRVRRTLLLGILVGGVVLSGLLFFPSQVSQTIETREVLIPKGAALEEIAGILHANELVGNPQLFMLAARVLGYDRGLKAGRFTIPVGSSIYRILRQLARGMAAQDMMTVPEGWRSDQIAQYLHERVKMDPMRFLALVGDSAFARSLGVPADRLEGYLFPETYPFYPLLSPEEIARVMVDRGLRTFGEEMARPGAKLGLTLHQLVTLASIVEAEAQIPSERPRIAAVFYNRLREGMMLQSDPTVVYALGVWRNRVLYKDLDVKSPYNTYRNKGLPPGPICNPGRGAFHAVLFPNADTTEFYFVARGDGTHIFSKAWEDHLRAIASVRAQSRRDSTLQPIGPGLAPNVSSFHPATGRRDSVR